jgi:hypothetical protein
MRDPKDITINGKQLSIILENHKKWLLDQEGGERANLRYADLQSANLQSADLRYADLRSAKNNEFAAALVTITPEGDLIGWKKLQGGLIAKLLIPAKAQRSNATGRKCRAQFAKVLEIWDGDKAVKKGNSSHDPDFVYQVGKTVKPDVWNENRWEECEGGIHFFITRIEAEKY